MMQYKGYSGRLEVDDEAGVLFGRVIGLRDVVTFQGKTVEEARQAFRDSVDDYLEFCAGRGEEPEQPYSGKFVVRTRPELHRALVHAAEARGQSLNSLVEQLLIRAVAAPGPPVEKAVREPGPGETNPDLTVARAAPPPERRLRPHRRGSAT